MTTVEQLAADLHRERETANRQATLDAVRTLVADMATDPQMWDRDTATLTPAGVEAVRVVMAQDTYGTADALLLARIGDEVAALEAAQRLVAEHTERRDALVRQAMGTSLPRPAIAEAARVKPARLYQIRDGRR